MHPKEGQGADMSVTRHTHEGRGKGGGERVEARDAYRHEGAGERKE